jgi:hypothetical protein
MRGPTCSPTSSVGGEGASIVNLDPRWKRNVTAIDILRRIRERSYQLWEQEGRPEGRHLDHWLQAEQELVAKCNGIRVQATDACLSKRYHQRGNRRAGDGRSGEAGDRRLEAA